MVRVQFRQTSSWKTVPVCSPAYRNAIGGLAKPEELLKAVLLRLPHEPWKPWFDAVGLNSDEPIRGPLFSDASLMLDAAAKKQGVALARSLIVEGYLASGRLVKVSEVSIPSPYAYYAVYSAEKVCLAEVKALTGWLIDSCLPSNT